MRSKTALATAGIAAVLGLVFLSGGSCKKNETKQESTSTTTTESSPTPDPSLHPKG